MRTTAIPRARLRRLPARRLVLLVGAAGLLTTMAAVVVILSTGVRVHPIDASQGSPVLRAGDAVVTVAIRPADAQPGDLITFPRPDDPQRLDTQRVVRMDLIGPIVAFETETDDASTASWTVEADGRLGRVIGRVPAVGRAVSLFASTGGRLALLGVPAVGLALLAATSATGRPRAASTATGSPRRWQP